MRDAIGGTFSLQIILFFLVLINAYLAFSVNYTKAFRIKNNIISIIEQQEGYTMEKSVADKTATTAEGRIFSLMKDANYNIKKSYLESYCPNNGYKLAYDSTQNTGFCLKFHENQDGSGYYSVVTLIDIDIPILSNLLSWSGVFAIKGETKSIYSNKLNNLSDL